MIGYHSVLQLLQEELYSGEWTPPPTPHALPRLATSGGAARQFLFVFSSAGIMWLAVAGPELVATCQSVHVVTAMAGHQPAPLPKTKANLQMC